MYSDLGTNFVGAEKEFRLSLEELKDDPSVKEALRIKDIVWKFNPPKAHHMGGSWERLISMARKVLHFLLRNVRLDDERFATLVSEAENILNNRPLTSCSDDPNDLRFITPNDLLQIKTRKYPPGLFTEAESIRKKWRFVQCQASIFWSQWKRQYVGLLSLRQKWIKPRRNISVGEVCLLVDEQAHRNQWPMCRVQRVFPDPDGRVRRVEVKTERGVHPPDTSFVSAGS